MKKIIKMEELDCANCAAKMEAAVSKIEGVQSCTISFMTQRMTLECEEQDLPEILKKAVAVCKKIEPDCVLKV